MLFCYKKYLKKLYELQKLHAVLSEFCQFEDGHVKPSHCSGAGWIVHLLQSMSDLVDRFRLYLQHFRNIANKTKKMDMVAMLEGKFKQLIDSSTLLLSAFFIDILVLAKIFSLVSQKGDFNIINMMNK